MQCFYHSLLQISLSQEFCPLWECLFSYRYPSFNLSVKYGISCNNIAYSYSRICSYYYIISFHPVCILTAVSFPLLIFNTFLLLTNIFIPSSFRLCSVYSLLYLVYRPLASCHGRLV